MHTLSFPTCHTCFSPPATKYFPFYRLPSLVPGFPLKYIVGPLQIRIPEIVSSRRPSYVLQAHLTPPTSMEPPSKRQKGGPGGPQKQQQQKRKVKQLTPEVEIRLAIQMAARERSIDNAFAAYDRAKELGIKLTLDSYACIMFLCSGGDDWEKMLSPVGSNPPSNVDDSSAGATAAADPTTTTTTTATTGFSSENVTPELMARGRALLEDMTEAGTVPNEICFTALARMEALAGNPDAAFAIAVSIAEKGLMSRLRCFTPALVAYAENGNAAKAFEVDAAISAVGLESGENEFSRLLQAASGGGVDYSAVEAVLHRMSRELQALQPVTIERAHMFFNSDAAKQVLDTSSSSSSSSSWVVEECSVGEDGACPAAGEGIKLAAIDLTPQEYEEFKKGVAELAAKQERQPDDFKIFVQWLEEHGPFGAVIDAANVAFYGQNYDSGGFSFAQVGAVVDRLHETHAALRPLVLLHVNRTKAQVAQSAVALALLDRLRGENCFFATPAGSNDDWYWMYAAVAAGNNGLLVYNDEMRDHLFHMLSPKFFGKWKQRHQLRYTFNGAPDSLEFDYPPPFTTCVQKLEGTATPMWVLPCVDGTWTLAKLEER
jgi:proteinaceous RNase P